MIVQGNVKEELFMNEIIRLLKSHRSIRNYEDKQIPDEYINEIVEAVQAAPSWINGQHVSIISVTSKEKKERLAKLVGNQAYVAQAPVFFIFCMDFHRTYLASEKHKKSLAVVEDVDALLVGSTDVGLAMGNAIAAAESLGLGIVPIGGIRRNPLDIIELLQLPKYVIPISGLCIGYAAQIPEQKPRLPKEAIFHQEQYREGFNEVLETYDKTIAKDNEKRSNGTLHTTWSERVATFYEKPYYEQIEKMLKQQGFTCKNMN